jgi:bifunctional polynucleotide phosphatase/kinase
MAAFDYDCTLVSPKDGKTFPKNIDDWQWLYPNIQSKIKDYYDKGYMIVIFSNLPTNILASLTAILLK